MQIIKTRGIPARLCLLLLLFFSIASRAQDTLPETQLWQKYRRATDSAERVKILIAISETTHASNRQAAEELARRAYELAKTLKQEELKIKALIRLINVAFENSNNPLAISLTTVLLNLVEEPENHSYRPQAHQIAGRNFHLRGSYPEALAHYFKGLEACEQEKDTAMRAELYNIIGGVYYNQGDVKNAYDYFNRGLQWQIKWNNKFFIGRGYLNVGSTYIIGKEFSKARVALDSAMQNYSRANSDDGKILVYTTLPDVFVAAEQNDSALKYLYLAYDYLKPRNKRFYTTQLDLQIARLLLKKGKADEALLRVKSGIESGVLNRQNHDLVPLYLLQSELLDKAGRTKEAFESYKLYKLISDSVINAASIKRQTEEALNYDFSRKEYQQQLQTQEKETRQRLYILVAVIAAAIVFFIFYYRYRLKQKANQLLEHTNNKLAEKNILIEEKSKALQESLTERELLLKEIHHRVKNNLQVISGLLELQKEELGGEDTKAAFDEGQSRIRSISLIHQNLYQNDKLGSIAFKTFVLELTEQVKEVFEQEGKEMAVAIDMPDNVLDIDTAVPLGLILNELLTNSYKYAASKTQQGSIRIELREGEKGNFVLRYADNGPGIKAGTDFETATTLGLRLIKGLSGQLAGKSNYRYQSGAVFEIEFKDAKARMKE